MSLKKSACLFLGATLSALPINLFSSKAANTSFRVGMSTGVKTSNDQSKNSPYNFDATGTEVGITGSATFKTGNFVFGVAADAHRPFMKKTTTTPFHRTNSALNSSPLPPIARLLLQTSEDQQFLNTPYRTMLYSVYTNYCIAEDKTPLNFSDLTSDHFETLHREGPMGGTLSLDEAESLARTAVPDIKDLALASKLWSIEHVFSSHAFLTAGYQMGAWTVHADIGLGFNVLTLEMLNTKSTARSLNLAARMGFDVAITDSVTIGTNFVWDVMPKTQFGANGPKLDLNLYSTHLTFLFCF